ncbi:YD repeat-containing protein [Flavobacterium sp. CF108]|uniref:RHS repeat domain-containing protein n=1 Tax=unclassified Flavobacterium TaxID=196869 RepID=UPI0008CCCEA3|nr:MULTISPECIES: RHS repeat domain-containing protein [unclassified Flavobacterium]SEP32775.1 YD repeat-containing protein [Flavobacterium sp. fv08]SHI03812.1 YD repeat-containing protein [Flavobacterium sp. CF108]
MFKLTFFKLLLFALFLPNVIFSQITKDLPNYFPVSPNAASFAKQGLYPIDYSTGKLNISIPIYTIKTKELTVPISLSYNTSGIQLNETASWVGLGWNLNAGGAIVRNAKGRPDGLNYWTPIPILSSNFAFTKENYQVLFDMQKGDRDTSPDEYIISAPGLSGSFYFDQNDSYKAYFRDFQNTKVRIISDTEIEITKDDGTIYKFGKNLQNAEVLEITSNPSELVQSWGSSFISAWYLTEIISANGKEVVSFSYKTINSTDYPVITSEHLEFIDGGFSPSTLPNYPLGNGYLFPIKKQFLQTITFPNGKIDFISTLDRQDLMDDYKLNSIEVNSILNNQVTLVQKSSFTYDYYLRTGGGNFSVSYSDPLANNTKIQNSKSYALRLKEIINNKTNTKHSFEYNSSPILRRGTTGQDYWGYMNGNTGSLIPPTSADIKSSIPANERTINFGTGNRKGDENIMKSGVLEKIVYPEGGYTIFEYEANRYIKNITNILTEEKSASISASGVGCTPNYNEISFTVGSNYVNQSGKISYYFSSATNETTGNNSYVQFNTTTYYRLNYDPVQQKYPTSSGTVATNFGIGYSNTLKARDYRSGISGPSGCPFLNINATWKETTGTVIVPTTIFIGGLRIKSIKNFLPGITLPVTEKQYTYEQENVLNDEGMGIYGRKIIFQDNISVAKPTYSSSTIYNSNIGSGPSMTYGKITETDINSSKNGKIEYYYENIPTQREIGIQPTIFMHPQYNTLSPLFSIISPYATQISDFGYYKSDTWNYGSLIKTKYYKNDSPVSFKVIKTIDNTYQKLIEKTLSTNIIFNIVSPPYNVSQNFPSGTYNQVWDSHSYQFFYFTGGISLGKKVLTSTTETEYDDNENPTNQKITTYSYENPLHYQLTKTETVNSKNETLKTQLSYPQDLVSTGQTAEMQGLINQNKIDKPIKTETFVNNVQTSESITKYEQSTATGNLLLPKEIHSSKGLVETFPFNNANRKINFTLYDTDVVSGVTLGNGNVLEYSLENGTPVSIIWGYNKSQPIAKIENAAYSQVSSYAANLQNLSNTGTEADLISALNTLRTALPNAMVTTYTYLPLVGVSTITDPKGYTTTYTYDSAGRLEFVKDNAGNILSENQYNYKP